LFSLSLVVLMVVWWPVSASFAVRALIAIGALSVPNSLRVLCFGRSDENLYDRILLFLIRPLAALWSSVVLARMVRLWGTLTVLRQGWTTRTHGAELVLSPAAGSAAVPAEEAVPAGKAVAKREAVPARQTVPAGEQA
jgi:hypothetical protein